MEKKEVYQQKIEGLVKEWDAKIEQLKAKAQQANADAKNHYMDMIEDVKARKAVMQARLHDLKRSGGGAWEEVKTGVEGALSELEEAYRKALAHFK